MKSVKRGDLFYANLNPVVGSEQGGIRPVLVIQNDVGNYYSSTVIIATLTSKLKKRLPTHIDIMSGEGNIKENSTILLEQIRTIDKFRLVQYLGKLSNERMCEIDRAMLVSLGLQKNI